VGLVAEALNVSRVGPVISFMPIILMGVLFGLAMDYEVFLVSRMREEYVHFGDARRAIHKGFTSSARVVTAAAVIMIGVFAAFVPNSDASVKPVALGLAVGVFVDAFVVRMTLVPAVMALLGDRAWWLPTWLDRRLPSLDVEGAGLEHHLDHESGPHSTAPSCARRACTSPTARRFGRPPVDAWSARGSFSSCAPRTAGPRAFMAALAGRLDISGGRLVVLDRVLPDEAAAVRARCTCSSGSPGRAPGRIGRRRRAGPVLVVV
jgi:RND superfamily putative drug exporter